MVLQPRHFDHDTQRRGMVLIAVLVVVVLLSLAAYQYSDLMLAEYRASVNAHKAVQARHFADSGIHYAAAVAAQRDGSNLFDNASLFQNVPVGDESKGPTGHFQIIAAPDPDDSVNTTSWRYGMTDEGGKININAFMKRDPTGQALYDALMKLPNMTQDLAASIVDWMDADDTPRQGGAESDYYSGESPPYQCKNGPLDSLDELLLVKGVTRDILYGNDFNRDGIQSGTESPGADGFSRGLAAYLTVYSREQNSDSLGQALTYINDTDLTAFYEKLGATEVGEDLTKFIIMYKQYGPSTGSTQTSGGLGGVGGTTGGGKGKGGGRTLVVKGNLANWTPDFTNTKTKQKISSLFELVGVQVKIAGKDPKTDPDVVYDSPLNDSAKRRDLLPKLFEHVSIFQESDIPARINVNTAPREVLATLTDLTDADVQAIMNARPKLSDTEAPDPIFQTPAWLLVQANLKASLLKKIEKNITTKSQVYYVQAIGQADRGGTTARVEAVIDTNQGRPRILMWRDLSELGTAKATAP